MFEVMKSLQRQFYSQKASQNCLSLPFLNTVLHNNYPTNNCRSSQPLFYADDEKLISIKKCILHFQLDLLHFKIVATETNCDSTKENAFALTYAEATRHFFVQQKSEKKTDCAKRFVYINLSKPKVNRFFKCGMHESTQCSPPVEKKFSLPHDAS